MLQAIAQKRKVTGQSGGNQYMALEFLGTGTSNGVPEIGCKCAVCASRDPRNRRLRSSVLIRSGGNNILIDTTPDLRIQALTHNVERVDAVLFTHHHADHIFGIDDLRKFNSVLGKALPCYLAAQTKEAIEQTFSYIFEPNPQFQSYIPQLELHVINGEFLVDGTEIVPIEVYHGGMEVLGFRIGGMAYLTDCNHIPERSKRMLADLDILILDALRPSYHVSHFSLNDAIREARDIRARETYFTHIAHDMDHEEIDSALPEGIHLAYDGLILTW